jgi:hypothetical protein
MEHADNAEIGGYVFDAVELLTDRARPARADARRGRGAREAPRHGERSRAHGQPYLRTAHIDVVKQLAATIRSGGDGAPAALKRDKIGP